MRQIYFQLKVLELSVMSVSSKLLSLSSEGFTAVFVSVSCDEEESWAVRGLEPGLYSIEQLEAKYG